MKKSIGVSPNIEALFGTRDENVRLLEDGLNITINLRSNAIELEGAARDVARAEQVFSDYESLQRSGYSFNNGDLNSMLRVLTSDPNSTLRGLADAGKQRSFGRRTVQPKSSNQRRYLEAIEKHDMPAGESAEEQLPEYDFDPAKLTLRVRVTLAADRKAVDPVVEQVMPSCAIRYSQ